MNKIDCFLIGHNEFDLKKTQKFLRLSFGVNSINYKEAYLLYLGHVFYKGNVCTPSLLYNELNQNNENNDSNSIQFYKETFSLTVAYLGSYLTRKGFKIDYINSFNYDKEKLMLKLLNDDIKTVAVTTTHYLSPFPIIEIIRFVRKYNENVKIIVGGRFIANNLKGVKDEDINSFLKSIGADIFVLSNEGEQTLEKVVDAVKNNKELNEISNIFYKKGDDYIFTDVYKEEIDLEKNSVNWELFKDDLTPFINMRTSVSCKFNCAFCSYPKVGGRYRELSTDKIEQELSTLHNSGKVKGIYFIDDTFNFPINRFKEILKMMIRNKYSFKWHSFVRCHHLDEEAVELMKKSGCQLVYLGLESGSQEILRNMKKGATVEKYKQGLSLLHKYEISSVASFIVGFPGETYKTYMETCQFIEENKPTFFRRCVWWCDTEASIYKEKDKYKIEGQGFQWKHSTMDSSAAHKLANNMFFGIKNSIFDSDFPFSFHLLNRKGNIHEIKRFLKVFNNGVIERLRNWDTEDLSQLYEKKLTNIVKS